MRDKKGRGLSLYGKMKSVLPKGGGVVDRNLEGKRKRKGEEITIIMRKSKIKKSMK